MMYPNILSIGSLSSGTSPLLACPTSHCNAACRMAAEYGLRLLYRREFHHVFEEFKDHPEFGPLMVKMKVVDGNGESSMDEDQWEAVSTCDQSQTMSPIFIALVFLSQISTLHSHSKCDERQSNQILYYLSNRPRVC